VAGGRAAMRVSTSYPWEGTVSVTVTASPAESWTLSLRVPHWCAEVSVAVNGEPVKASPADGYLRLARPWQAGDTVTLELAMPVRLTQPDPRVDAVRGCVALERGPLVYCLESTDQPADTRLDDITLLPAAEVTASWRPELLDGVTVVETAGRRRSRPVRQDWWPYQQAGTARPDSEPVALTAVPYFAWANRDPGAMRIWIPTD
jgi:uncharacterized protein